MTPSACRLLLRNLIWVALAVTVWPVVATAAPTAPYKRTVIVGGGTAAQNGAALLAAMAGTGTAGPANPWLIQLEPGVYALGAKGLALRSYVDIEGSGRGVTTITSTGNNKATLTAQGAVSAEIRELTLENVATAASVVVSLSGSGVRLSRLEVSARGKSATAVQAVGGSLRLSDVAVRATATAGEGKGFDFHQVDLEARDLSASVAGTLRGWGLTVRTTNPTTAITFIDGLKLRIAGPQFATGIALVSPGTLTTWRITRADVEVTGSAGATGVHVTAGGVLAMTESSVTASAPASGYALVVEGTAGSAFTVERSTLRGSAYSILNNAPLPVLLATTRLEGELWIAAIGGTLVCVDSYDENFAALSDTCS